MPRPAPASALDLLPDDLLVGLFLRLPFTDRLKLTGVCRRLRQLCSSPSPLWRHVPAVSRRLRRQPGQSKLELDAAALQLVDAFAR